MTAMRVLVVTPWFPSALLPGSGIFNLRDAELLAKDHDITVLHLISPSHADAGEPAETTVGAIRVLRQPFVLSNPGLLRQARTAIRHEAKQADLVHTMALPALLPMRLANTGKPWVHTEHYSSLVTPPPSARMKLALGVLKRLFRKPDETVAVSVALANVIDCYRLRPSTVIGNEVMLPAGVVPGRRDLSAELRIISVGGIIARKGPLIALNAVAELRRRGLNATLTWVGDGDQREELLRAADSLGVSDSLRLTGQLEPSELSRELLEADLFLLPVETETFGVAIAEALTHGLPVVATGTGGHEEFLPQQASRLVAERAATPLADAVQSLIGDAGLWGRAEIAAHAQGMFSEQTRREQYAGVYDRAIRLNPEASR